ncbi:MAG: YidB family protein [Smithella sp.]
MFLCAVIKWYKNKTIQNLAAKVGISPDELSAKLSEFLPTAIDQLTPDGSIPLYQAL